ncbi:hypothetical protein CWB98_22690 [Pseudoalteromonas rubra]|uniref:Uncharacterized protein n=1 Tax=Pseudoalteromonas rubra TaxID=43658 RepID=A0A5S3WR65_9GAMM|nr:hypothetical protein CWB98_22690 [Pseudoalteromonas rubra]
MLFINFRLTYSWLKGGEGRLYRRPAQVLNVRPDIGKGVFQFMSFQFMSYISILTQFRVGL